MKKILIFFVFISVLSCTKESEEIEQINDATFFQHWDINDILINDKIWGVNNGYYFDIKPTGKIKLKDVIGETELAFTWKRSDDGYNDSIITIDINRCYKVWKRVSNYELGLQHTINKGSKTETILYSSRKF